ncbi:MAG: hypothetical protein RR101_14415 [Burkholderiaceae bacterium]
MTRTAAKPAWQSTTLWVNALVAALVALELGWGVLQPLLPVNVYSVIAVALPVINAVLRVFTNSPVCLRRHDETQPTA